MVAPELVFDTSVAVALKFAAMPRDARHKSKVGRAVCMYSCNRVLVENPCDVFQCFCGFPPYFLGQSRCRVTVSADAAETKSARLSGGAQVEEACVVGDA